MKKFAGVLAGLLGVAILGWWVWRRWGKASATEHSEHDEAKRAERRIGRAA